MKADIVARLRGEIAWEPEVGELMTEAADEVELLRLTDAEREAVEWFAFYGYSGDGVPGRHAATLRGLLERTKAEELVDARTVSEPGAALRVTAVPIPPKIQAAMAEAIRRPFP